MIDKIRILAIITTSFVPYGGLTTVAMNYYRNIDKSRYHMDFASTNDAPERLVEELKENGSKYYKLNSRMKRPLSYMRKLRKISMNYDVVHIHANSATAVLELLPAKLAGAPKRVLHIHNSTCSHKLIHKLFHPMMLKLTTDNVACSKLAGDWIFKDYIVLNNAVDLKKYNFDVEKRSEIRKNYNIFDDDLVIGHVGKFVEQKNHNFLIDVFQEIIDRLPNSKLLLVGSGDLIDEIRLKVKNLNLQNNIIFAGMQNDASPFYSAMDMIVFPSLWEGLPLSILEAQANGLPCVISENITFEVNMGGVQQVSLSEKASVWADIVINTNIQAREARSEEYRCRMRDCGFDIEKSVKELERIYKS